jgi:adenylate cyclase
MMLTLDDIQSPVLYVEGTPWTIVEYNHCAIKWLSSDKQDTNLRNMKLSTVMPTLNQGRLERRISKGRSATFEMELINDSKNRTALFHFRPFKNGVLIEGSDHSSVKETKAMLTSYSQMIENKQKELQQEYDRAEALLANILPKKSIQQLKILGKTIPERYADVSVLFLDFVGFTVLTQQMEPERLFSELNEIFTRFDTICEKFECERIKTIGDAYLAVSGMHTKNEQHAFSITSAAIEMREYLFKRNKTSEHKWLCRIGIHSGPLMGGVVGKLKYIYDVFGDGVNTAARMETSSEPMKINISQSTYSKIHLNFTVKKRALLPIKGKGSMQTYFVHDHKK